MAGFAVFMANSALVVTTTGEHAFDIDGHPTRRSGRARAGRPCPARCRFGRLVGLAALDGARTARRVDLAVSFGIAGGYSAAEAPRHRRPPLQGHRRRRRPGVHRVRRRFGLGLAVRDDVEACCSGNLVVSALPWSC